MSLCIRRYFPLSVAKGIAAAPVTNRLDYCRTTSLFQNIAFKDTTEFECVNNC